jgi:hypothetical protein
MLFFALHGCPPAAGVRWIIEGPAQPQVSAGREDYVGRVKRPVVNPICKMQRAGRINARDLVVGKT